MNNTYPTKETYIIVTLDQLRPYDHNPRLIRNPRYDEIKASILKHHLNEPPIITRRPNENYYIIRSGGNTRLSILNELWTETRNRTFYEFGCLFKPWVNELNALTDHLIENDMRGELHFIERALGVHKAKTFIEQERNKSISQTELAKILSSQGYPTSQSEISRMQETVHFLLPVIPTALYAGLNITNIRAILKLRNAAQRVWDKTVKEQQQITVTFSELFHDVLSSLDAPDININRIQDELIHHLSQILHINYDMLMLEIENSRTIQNIIDNPSIIPTTPKTEIHTDPEMPTSPSHIEHVDSDISETICDDPQNNHDIETEANKVQNIQKMISEHTGKPVNDYKENVVKAIPIKAGGLYPISDLWHIDSCHDTPEILRQHIAQLALEIAAEIELSENIQFIENNMGYIVKNPENSATLSLLDMLSQQEPSSLNILTELSYLHMLLLSNQSNALTDKALIKLFRIVRLGRRLFVLMAHEKEDV